MTRANAGRRLENGRGIRRQPGGLVGLAARSRAPSARRPDWPALRAALDELGRLVGVDTLVVEIHRADRPEPFLFIHTDEQMRRWELARSIRLALDQALAAELARVEAA